jgi:hypothetical protein
MLKYIMHCHYILSDIKVQQKENILIDSLIICCFTPPSRIFHLYGDLTIAGEGLQNVGLCSVLRAFEQGRIFIVPQLPLHVTSFFPVSYDTYVELEDLFYP